MKDRIIYHICRAEDWNAAVAAGYYLGSAQDRRDGFIHFSAARQIGATAARFYAGKHDLLLLAVDSARLGPDLIWEPSAEGDLFPHLYTRMPISAVIEARPLSTGSDGLPALPPLGPDGFR